MALKMALYLYIMGYIPIMYIENNIFRLHSYVPQR